MPRIAADSVAEHVARQEAAVVDAAARLFAERGVAAVSLADVAAEVGLARNSLYRYVPDKAHLLAIWFRRELEPLQAASEEIARRPTTAADRLDAWLALHLGYLTAPEHQAMMTAALDPSALSDDVRDDLATGHRDLYATLAAILAELAPERDSRVLTMLVVGLLRSATDLVVGGADAAAVGAELRRSARAVAAAPA